MNTNSHCEELVEEYLRWLKAGITANESEGVCEITTPFLDRHNDHLTVYVIRQDGELVLSDAGYILADLRMSGVDIGTERRSQILETTLRGFGVTNSHGVLEVRCRPESLAKSKHNLLQAMLAVDEFYVMGQEHTLSFFLEDVKQFLASHEVRVFPRFKLTGRSGLEHSFDFGIAASSSEPERLIRAIGSPTRDAISSYCFSWADTSKERDANSRAIAILNDKDQPISPELVHALQEYQIQPLAWSRREEFVTQLAA